MRGMVVGDILACLAGRLICRAVVGPIVIHLVRFAKTFASPSSNKSVPPPNTPLMV